MDDETKRRLAEFSARFRAQRQDTEKRKIDAKLAKQDTTERKELNRKFHVVNVNPDKGTPLQQGEADAQVAAHYAALRTADDTNWQPLAIIVTGQWQVCRCCGHEAVATSGIYFREQHKTLKSAKRLRHIGRIIDGFDIEANIEGVELARCIKCLALTDDPKAQLVDDLLSTMLHGGDFQLSNQMELFNA